MEDSGRQKSTENEHNEQDTDHEIDYNQMSESQEARLYDLEMSLRGEKRSGSPLHDEERPYKLANIENEQSTKSDEARGNPSPPSNPGTQDNTVIPASTVAYSQDYANLSQRLDSNSNANMPYLAYPTPQTGSTTAYSPQQFVQPTRFFAQSSVQGTDPNASPQKSLPHYNDMLANLKHGFTDDSLYAGHHSPPTIENYQAGNAMQQSDVIVNTPSSAQVEHSQATIATSSNDTPTHEQNKLAIQTTTPLCTSTPFQASGIHGLGITGLQAASRYATQYEPVKSSKLSRQMYTPAQSPVSATSTETARSSSHTHASNTSSFVLNQDRISQELQRQDALLEQQNSETDKLNINQPKAPQDTLSQESRNQAFQQVQQEYNVLHGQTIPSNLSQTQNIPPPQMHHTNRQPRTVHISRAGDPPAAMYNALQQAATNAARSGTPMAQAFNTGGRRGSVMPAAYANAIPQSRSAPPMTEASSLPNARQIPQGQMDAQYLAAVNAQRHQALGRQGSLSATLAPPPAPLIRLNPEEHAFIKAVFDRRELAKRNIDNQALAEDVRQYWTHEYLRANEEIEYIKATIAANTAPGIPQPPRQQATSYGYYPTTAGHPNTHSQYYPPQAMQARTIPQYPYGHTNSGYAYGYPLGQSTMPYNATGQPYFPGSNRPNTSSSLQRMFPENTMSQQSSNNNANSTAQSSDQQSSIAEGSQSLGQYRESIEVDRSRQTSNESRRSLRSQTSEQKPVIGYEDDSTDFDIEEHANKTFGDDSGVAWTAENANKDKAAYIGDAKLQEADTSASAVESGQPANGPAESTTSGPTSKDKRSSKKVSPAKQQASTLVSAPAVYQKPTNKKGLDITLSKGDLVIETEWHRNESCFRNLTIAWTSPDRDRLTYWWTANEIAVSRRLVRFSPSLNIDTGIISVATSTVQPELYDHAAESVNPGVVVSLFFCEGIDRGKKTKGEIASVYWITQHDIFRLVETFISFHQRTCHYTGTTEPRPRLRSKLANSVKLFNVPKTSTNEQERAFFQQLTTCTDPAPCSDNKAQKVVAWAQLDKALEDMLSRFWLVAYVQ